MQKILSIMSIFSFVTSIGVIGTAGYVYVNKDNITDSIKEQVTKGVQDAIVGQMDVPALPETTGGVLPF
jgi:hypothetical protein